MICQAMIFRRIITAEESWRRRKKAEEGWRRT